MVPSGPPAAEGRPLGGQRPLVACHLGLCRPEPGTALAQQMPPSSGHPGLQGQPALGLTGSLRTGNICPKALGPHDCTPDPPLQDHRLLWLEPLPSVHAGWSPVQAAPKCRLQPDESQHASQWEFISPACGSPQGGCAGLYQLTPRGLSVPVGEGRPNPNPLPASCRAQCRPRTGPLPLR